MDQPCESLHVGHVVGAVIYALQAVAIAWLVNRRYQADKRENGNGHSRVDQMVQDHKVVERRRVRRRNSEEP